MALIQEVLARASRDTPDKEALVCGDRRLTFAAVDEASSRLAAFLTNHGVARGDRVGIFSHKCIEEVIALFAIVKAGGVFVPINPHFLDGQLARVVDDCGIATLFASASKAGVIDRAYPDQSPLERIVSFSPEMSLHGGAADLPNEQCAAQAVFSVFDLAPDRPVTHFQFLGRSVDGTVADNGVQNFEPSGAEDDVAVFVFDPYLGTNPEAIGFCCRTMAAHHVDPVSVRYVLG